jgi:hypothetical protein
VKAAAAALTLTIACSGAAFAQGPAGRGEDPPTAFRDTFEEIERNQLLESPASRKALAVFARCVIEHDAVRIGAVLNRDFRTSTYRKALDRVNQTNRDCMARTGHTSMRLGSLPLAAALSEELIERDATPLNVRLARAAAGKTPELYGPSDAIAMCVAKSAPDDVARLFSTEPDSDVEKAASDKIIPVLGACATAVRVPGIQTSPFGLRSIVATAAYRLLAAQSS